MYKNILNHNFFSLKYLKYFITQFAVIHIVNYRSIETSLLSHPYFDLKTAIVSCYECNPIAVEVRIIRWSGDRVTCRRRISIHDHSL